MEKKIWLIWIKMDKIKHKNQDFGTFARGRFKKVFHLSDLKKISKGDLVHIVYDGDILGLVIRAIDLGVVGFAGNFGKTDHGVIAAKELGISFHLTSMNFSGDKIYSLSNNEVIEGPVKFPTKKKNLIQTRISTDKKVCINLGFPNRCISDLSVLPDLADGVGFARMEFAILEMMAGQHPLKYLKKHGPNKFSDELYKHFAKSVKRFEGKIFWIRTDDFSPNNLFHLKGGKDYEKETSNEIVGFRGIARSIDNKWLNLGNFEPSLDNVSWPGLQFEVINRLASEFPATKIGLFAPMVHNAQEYKTWKSLAQKIITSPVAYGVMVEIPALSGEGILPFLEENLIDFMIFGTNDLTSLILGVDRSDVRLSHLFNEENPAVLRAILKTIEYCKAYGVSTAIGGQAASRPSMISHLYKAGLDIFSVNPDLTTVQNTKKVLFNLEKKQI